MRMKKSPMTRSLNFQSLLSISLLLCTLAIAACGDNKSSEKTVQELPQKKSPPPFRFTGNLNELVVPNNLVAIGGLNQVDQASTQIKNSLISFLPTPLDLRSMWLDNYVQTEMLLDPKHIHPQRPLRFIQLADEGTIHTVRLIGINSITELQKSLGQYVTTKVVENKTVFVQNRYKDDKNPLYFVELDYNIIASTYHPKLLGANYLKFYNEVARRKVDGLINAIFFPKKAGENWQAFQESENRLDQLELKGSARSIARQKSTLKKIMALAKQVALDSEKTSFVVNIDQPRVSLNVDWALKPGSNSALLLAQLKGSEHQLLKYVSSASFLLSLQLPKATLQLIIQEWNSLALSIIRPNQIKDKSEKKKAKKRKKTGKNLPPVLTASKELMSDYLKLTQDAAAHLDGSILLATVPFELANKAKKKSAKVDNELLDETLFLPPTNQKALRWIGLFGHDNLTQVSEQIQRILSVYKIPEIAKNMRKRGLRIKIKNDLYTSHGQKLETIHIKTRMPRTPPLLRPLRPQLKELYNAHLWLTKDLGAVGFANNWKQSFDLLLESIKDPSIQTGQLLNKAMQAGLKNPLLFLYLDPISTISALKRGRSGSMLLPLQMMFTATKASEGLSLTVQSHQNSLKARLNIPHDFLKAIKSGMSGTSIGQ